MGISFPHTLDRNQRYAYWFPFTWSQRDDSPSLSFTASCKISLCGTFMQRGAFMTRPKKGESLIKTKGVHLRMSETEYEILSEKAIATNMSISDFIEKETPRREICLCLFAHYNRQRFHSLPKFPLNRYTTPHTVCIYTGCPGSSSIFSLMLQICRITTL